MKKKQCFVVAPKLKQSALANVDVQIPRQGYLGNRLKLLISMMNQIHHSIDSLRGVKIFCQSF